MSSSNVREQVARRRYLLAEDTIDQQDIEELIAWLQTGPWLTQGRLVREFEASWASWMGSRFACFVNSGSSANLLMYQALLVSGRLTNDRVIVPAVSWPTTIAPAMQLGMQPIMCEADRDTFGLDLDHLEQLLQQHQPAAVICVHVLGVPNQMEQLMALKQRYGFLLMEDACAATGSTYDGQHVGTFGDLSSFSLFFGHHLSTIEGGMVCTDDEELYDLLLMLRSHGWATDLAPEKEAQLAEEHQPLPFNRRFTFYHPGFNLRSSDLNARIGLSQMRKADHVVARRCENHRIYQSRLGEETGLHCQRNERAQICSISFATIAQTSAQRDRIASLLTEQQIETRPLGGGNMSRQPFWASRYGSIDFPMADRIRSTCFHLPNHPGLQPDDIHHICDVVRSAMADQ